ncbi:adenylate kinase [Microbulbifer sp. TYP-18]|uniref:adenylate kinase n=1 Tax=Microbulbifer sp. TYP-18 TaxID=3230024 RepID=UPI0034C64BE2
MNRVALFGNAGGGKSSLALQLAEATGLPLYSIDKLQYRAGGVQVPHQQYLQSHACLVKQPEWIIDGFGCMTSAWERFSAADTLVYIDLPLWIHGFWVTKRLFKGLFRNPEGWPENSPIWRGSWTSYKVLWLCHRQLTPQYRQLVKEVAMTKQVNHLTSPAEIRQFAQSVRQGYSRSH